MEIKNIHGKNIVIDLKWIGIGLMWGSLFWSLAWYNTVEQKEITARMQIESSNN